jgi:hypothetical protein
MEDSIRSWDGMNNSLPASSHWDGGGGKDGGALDLPPPRKWGSKAGGGRGSDEDEGRDAHKPSNPAFQQGGGGAEVWRPEDDEFDVEEEPLQEFKPQVMLPSFSTARGVASGSSSRHDEKPVLYMDSLGR